MRQLGVQEVDIVSIVEPITKYAVTVLDPVTIRYHLEKAAYLARSGRPGPVWIDIPLDVQAFPIDVGELAGFDPAELARPPRDVTLGAQVERIIASFNQSQRPLVFAGNGIRLAKAEKEFAQLVELLKAPVVASWCAADLISSDDSLFVGRPGSVASRGANFALQNCDFLLAIGLRLDFAITGYAPDKLARAAHKVVVDIDPAELGKLAPHIQTPICADAGAFLRALLERRDHVARVNRREWAERCAIWKTRYPVVTAEHRKPEGRVSIYHLAEVLGGETDASDVMISGSSGSGIEIFLLACPTRTGQRIFHTAGLGAMGYGIPSSIAACLAAGRQRTVCVDGDGGFQFNVQDLETVSRLRLPIKFFVLNNDGYASIRASQSELLRACEHRLRLSTGLTVPDLSKIAAAYDLPAAVISDQSELRRDVRKRARSPRTGGLRRPCDSRRGPGTAAVVHAAPGRIVRVQASRRPLAVPRPRGIPREHARSAAAGLEAHVSGY